MKLDNITNQIYIIAFNEAKLRSHEFVTPEHSTQEKKYWKTAALTPLQF